MLRAIFILKRSSSSFTQQTLESLGTKLKPQAVKIDIPPVDSSKKKKKIKLADNEYIPPYRDESREYFASIKPNEIKLPEVLVPVEKEWNTARQYLESRTKELNKYADKMLEPGPRGLHWEEIENHGEHMSSNEIRSWIRQHKSQLSLERTIGSYDGEEEITRGGRGTYLSDEINGDVFANQYFKLAEIYDPKIDLRKYPGSILGPNMEDDPSYWAEWYVKNQPRPLQYFEQFGLMGGIYLKEQIGKFYTHPEILKTFMTTHYKPYEYIMNHPEETFIVKPSSPDSITAISVLEDEEYLPVPKELPMNYIDITRALERWNVYPAMETSLKLKKRFDRGEKFPTPNKPWKPVSYSSCLNYYEMLPRYYREHRLVVSVALILDRCRPLMSRKNKEIFLNKLCNFLTPRDETKYKFLQEYFIKKETLNLDNPQVDYDPAWDSDTEEFKKSLIEEWESRFYDTDEDRDSALPEGPEEEEEEAEESKETKAATPAATTTAKKDEKKKFPAKDKQNRVKKSKIAETAKKEEAASAPQGGGEEEEEDEDYEYVDTRDYGPGSEEDEDEEGDPWDEPRKSKKKKAKEAKVTKKPKEETKRSVSGEPEEPKKKKKFADEESEVSASEEDEFGENEEMRWRKDIDVTKLTSIERENMVDYSGDKQVVKDPNELKPLPRKQKEMEKIQSMSKEERELMSMLGETITEKRHKFETYDWEIPDYGVNWFERNHENPDGVIPSVITYYDNKDGYWDEWIKEKHERIGLPHMTRRCFLKH